MSAPQTNIEKQKRFHWGPLTGMAVVVIFAVGLLLFWIFYEVDSAENPAPDTAPELPAATGSVDQGNTVTEESSAP